MLSDRRNLIVLGTLVLGALGLAFILYLNVRPERPIEGIVQFPRRRVDTTIHWCSPRRKRRPPVGNITTSGKTVAFTPSLCPRAMPCIRWNMARCGSLIARI